MKRCLACEGRFESDDWTCPRCGLSVQPCATRYFNSPRTANAQAGFKPEYFARLAAIEQAHFWFRARNELIQWALGNYFPNAKSFFEIGCGTGFVLAGIREKFPANAPRGQRHFHGRPRLCQSTFAGAWSCIRWMHDAIPFECEFDVVGAFDVLEHLVEDEKALAQMFNAARPGGGLLVTVPQQRYLWSASDEHAMHQRRYSRAELREKSRAPGSKSSESLLSIRCYFRL